MILELTDWNSVLKQLDPNDVVWFLAACFVSLYIYSLTRKEKEPRYILRTVRNIPKKYHGIEMEDNTVTRVLFWNNGRDTIHFEDIAQADQLRFAAKERGNIMNAKIIQVKTDANQFRINIPLDKSAVMLSFDYVDKNEGAVIEIVHTGRSYLDIEFRGKIKGGGTPKQKLSFFELFREITLQKALANPRIKNPSSIGLSYSKSLMVYSIGNFFLWLIAGVMVFSTLFVGFSFWGGLPSLLTKVIAFILMGYVYRIKYPRGFNTYKEDL